jgi:hypothetical protein
VVVQEDVRVAVRRTLLTLLEPDQTFQLLALMPGKKPQIRVCGYDEIDEAVAWAAERDDTCEGIYVTLNPIDPALRETQTPAKNKDVLKRRFLFIDSDPIRPDPNSNSTDGERVNANYRSYLVWKALKDCFQFPEPLIANSGNGYHLLYYVDLPADDGGLIEKILQVFSELLTDDKVKIDVAVKDPVRKVKLYGTSVRKGPATPDRPYRKSKILWQPLEPGVVPREKLEAVAALLPEVEKKAKDKKKEKEAKKQTEKKKRLLSIHNVPAEERSRRAIAYVAKMPPAVQGEEGHKALFAVACALVRGFDLSKEDARKIILDDYNTRCVPPWKPNECHEIDHKLNGTRSRAEGDKSTVGQ